MEYVVPLYLLQWSYARITLKMKCQAPKLKVLQSSPQNLVRSWTMCKDFVVSVHVGTVDSLDCHHKGEPIFGLCQWQNWELIETQVRMCMDGWGKGKERRIRLLLPIRSLFSNAQDPKLPVKKWSVPSKVTESPPWQWAVSNKRYNAGNPSLKAYDTASSDPAGSWAPAGSS